MSVQLSRRQVLSGGAAAGAAAVVPSVQAASRPEAGQDPDLASILARMTNLHDRALSLPLRSRHLALLATLVAAGAGEESVAPAVSSALDDGVAPVAIREAILQCAPYAGMARAATVMRAALPALASRGVALPVQSETTVTDETRFTKGLEVQTAIFGNAIRKMHESAPEGQRRLLIDDLSGWCFGDFYTRGGLTVAERELVTFVTIAALGGCEPQLRAHASANLSEGATKQNLIDALESALPHMGYPRTLNALGVVNAVTGK